MNLNREEIFIRRGVRKDWAPNRPKGYPTPEEFQRELDRLKAADPDIYHDLIAHPERFSKKPKALSYLGPVIREGFRECHGDTKEQAFLVRSLQYLRGEKLYRMSGESVGTGRIIKENAESWK